MAKKLLYAGKVTGTSYYVGWDAKCGEMKVGEPIGLRRDRTNPYDSRATAVMYEGTQIGWVPKASNHAIAAALDNSDAALEAVITKINRQGSFEDRLYISITADIEDLPVTNTGQFKTNIDFSRLETQVWAEHLAEACHATTILSKYKEPPMSQIGQIIDKNKQTAVSAAFMEAGRIANNQVSKLAAKQLPVMVRGYAETPVGKLVLANIANFAAQKLRPEDQRLSKLTGAMMVQAYQELYADFDIEQMLEDLLENSTIKKALKTVGDDLPSVKD